MVIDVKSLSPLKKVLSTTPQLTTIPAPSVQSKTPSPFTKSTTPSVTPRVVPVESSPSPSKSASSSQICDHVFAEAYDMKTGKHYKRCLYCRATDLPFKIVRIK